MARQGFFESEKDFKARAKREALEESSGLSQGFFESDEDYETRAMKEALRRISGVSQGFFEPDDVYLERAEKEALRITSGLPQGLFELDEEYEERASREALSRISGERRRLLESEDEYETRALNLLADNPRGIRGYVYLSHEAKRHPEIKTDRDSPDNQSFHTSSTETYSHTPEKEVNFLWTGIIIGLLIDVAIYILTFGGLLLDVIFGKQSYNFILVIPPIIGGVLGAICTPQKG